MCAGGVVVVCATAGGRSISQLWGRSCHSVWRYAFYVFVPFSGRKWVCSDTSGPLLDPARIYWGQIWEKIKITLLSWNYSSAFDPSRFAPVEHTHAQGHTLMETDAIYWSSGQLITAPGEHGGTLLKGTSAVARSWTATAAYSCQSTNLFWAAREGIEPSDLWTTQSNHWAMTPMIPTLSCTWSLHP